MKRNRRPRWLTVAVAAAAVILALVLWYRLSPSRLENVVFIVVDTTRADHLGSYGYRRDTTPHIDRLARESAVFEQAYSHSPWTMPSVASMFTSLTPRDHGIVKWEQPLPVSHLTLAEHLQARGFHTAAFVSHLIFQPRYNYNQGFDDFDHSVLKKGDPVKISSSKEISDLAIDWLDRAREPFFIWLHYFDAHAWYMSHESFEFGKRPIDKYDSEVRYTDEHIGRVLQALEERGLRDDTIIVFVADHGEEFHDHGGTRHSKTLFDELVRVPLVFHVPGFEAQRIPTVVSESDLAPTLCELLGVPVPEQFRGEPFAFDGSSFRVEGHRMVFMETLRKADKRGVRYDRWKLIHDREKQEYELFDLGADPEEKRNVVLKYAEVAERLKKSVEDHYRGERSLAEELQMSDRLRKQLEALGYLH